MLCEPRLTNGKRKKAIHICRSMISFTIDSMGAANKACVGDGLVGEGGRATRSSLRDGRGHIDKMWKRD